MHKLPDKNWNEEDRYPNIRCYESRSVPSSIQEHGESGYECDYRRANEAVPSGVWLQRRLPRQGVATDSLCLQGLVESDIAQTESGPDQ